MTAIDPNTDLRKAYAPPPPPELAYLEKIRSQLPVAKKPEEPKPEEGMATSGGGILDFLVGVLLICLVLTLILMPWAVMDIFRAIAETLAAPE